MKKLINILSAGLLATAGTVHAAGYVQGVTVVNVDVRADGYFLVTFSQAITAPALCVSVFNRMSGNANTAGGRAVLAAALLAYSNHSLVTYAHGVGACNEYGGIESIQLFAQGG